MTEYPSRRSRRAQSTDRWVALPPDPAVLNALGGGHTLESAIADIIDNSVDASAGRVRVRLITQSARLLGLQIRDDGTGMSEATLEQALTLGNRREYGEADLGHFGIGLKAASMRHTETLAVYTAFKHDDALRYAGIELTSTGTNTEVGATVIGTERAKLGYLFGAYEDAETSGTVVQWSNIKGASAATQRRDREEWLEATIDRIRHTLGLIFHRFLENGDIQLQVDVYDVDLKTTGPPRTVRPVNPFGYRLSGNSDFPIDLHNTDPSGTRVSMRAHILPPKGNDRLGQKKEDWQGLYVYRHNRLLTFNAGWHGLTTPKGQLKLARVSLELTDELMPFVSPSPEKNGVTFRADVLRLLEAATNDAGDVSFTDYLDCAITTIKEANRRSTEKPITQISSGLPTNLLDLIGESFGWRTGKDPVAIRWVSLPPNRFFVVSLDRRELQLNARYRDALGGDAGSNQQILALLIYLLTEENYTRDSHLRTSTLDHHTKIEQAILAVLNAAEETVSKPAATLRRMPPEALQALRPLTPPMAPASLTSPVPDGTPAPAPALVEPVAEPVAQPVAPTFLHEAEDLLAGFDLATSSDQLELFAPSTEKHADEPDELDEFDELNIEVDVEVEVEVESASETELDDATEPDSTGPDSSGPEVPTPLIERTATLPAMPSGPLTTADLEAFTLYCGGHTIAEAAHELNAAEHAIALSLAKAFFGDEATEDDATLAPYHGMAYTPEERERILRLFHSSTNDDVVEVARQVGRTPFAVAWRLLDSPKRPVAINKRVRRSVRRRVADA